MECVVVERLFDPGVTLQDVRLLDESSAWCKETYGIRLLQSYVSADGKRVICVYEAPDAEAVRVANRQAGAPFEIAWKAAVYHPAK
jgi:hypothetical protein